MRVTNLESYFDGVISSHDYNIAKEEQGFWQQLEQAINLDNTNVNSLARLRA